MSLACRREIAAAIAHLKPCSVITVSQEPGVFEPALHDFEGLTVHSVSGRALRSQIASIGHCDLALVAHLDQLDKQEGSALLAALRDVYSDVCLVLFSPRPARGAEVWTQEDLAALGFRLHVHCGAQEAIYRFSLADYKTTPDWLNSRSWANPRLWEKYRW